MKLLDQNFFYASKIGFEFEFLSAFTREEIAEKIGESIGKKVKVFKRYHSSFTPTRDIFKLEPDFSGGFKMVELITGPMDYFEAIPVLIRILKWIEENGYTNDKCALQFSISFDRNKYPNMVDVRNLNTLKFCLKYDEEFVWSRFPERRGSLYAKTIKRITPAHRFVGLFKNTIGDKNSYSIFMEKNMGVNLTKLKKGYFEIRYMGGKNYEKKYPKVKEIIDYTIETTFRCLLENDTLTQKETSQLSDLVTKIYSETETFLDPTLFIKNYPDFHVSIDLREDLQGIKTYFESIKEILYSLIVDNQITRGFLNYDTQVSRYQLKDAETQRASIIKDIDLIECKIEGNISNCRLFGCEIKNAQIDNSGLIMKNEISDSKIIDCDLLPSNTIINSYIDCRDKEISCEVEGGIIRSGYITKIAHISSTTEVIYDDADGKGKYKDKYKGKGKGEKKFGVAVFPNLNHPDNPDSFSDRNPSNIIFGTHNTEQYNP